MKKFSTSVFATRNGSMYAVVGSGKSDMSDSWIAWKPRIEEPSKFRPSSKTDWSNDETGTVKCCIMPGRSQNRTSTISTPSSLMPSARVHQVGLEGPHGSRQEQLGTGHGHVTQPDECDRQQALGGVGEGGDAAADHEERRGHADVAQRGADVGDGPRHVGRQEDAEHGVGAEEPGEQDRRRVGALDQPERDHDVEQHLVGPQGAEEERHQHPPGVRQRARAGDALPGLAGRDAQVVGRPRHPADRDAVDRHQGSGEPRGELHDGEAVGGEREAAEQGAQGEPGVEPRVEVRLRAQPLLARHDVEDVGLTADVAQGLERREHHAHQQVALEGVDEGERGHRHAAAERRRRPHPLRPEAVGQPPEGVRQQERRDHRDGDRETRLGRAEADDLDQEDRARGVERALADGEEQRLRGEAA
jgi:hypothetical protein